MDAKPDAATRTYTRREFLTYQSMMNGAPWPLAMEAVSSWAIENPDVDMDEAMTWREWNGKAKK